jgi:hypothetical protein
MENQKLTQEELNKIAELQEKNRAIVNEFGEIRLIEINLKRRSDNAEKFLTELREEENAFGKELSEKYGDGTVDLQSGEFVPAPQPEAPAEEPAAE